jgi:protein disulfide-isomerase
MKSNIMKALLFSIVAGLAILNSGVRAGELEWGTDLAKAQAKAKAENKKVLINFTGSDWCGFCIKLQKEVFTTAEFQEYAKKHLVLVEADFPHNKTLPADLKAANEKLKEAHKVRGYPTLVLLSSSGTKLGEVVGYGGGGPQGVIAKLDGLKGGS